MPRVGLVLQWTYLDDEFDYAHSTDAPIRSALLLLFSCGSFFVVGDSVNLSADNVTGETVCVESPFPGGLESKPSTAAVGLGLVVKKVVDRVRVLHSGLVAYMIVGNPCMPRLLIRAYIVLRPSFETRETM